ncbi:Pleiotropic drug resistance protein 2 [Helianthus annuus]|nr:Pleiotropic drug resistance protein 2 [Helianthus annuus]
MVSLLQPALETFDLFDDIVLLSEGQIVYQGPRVMHLSSSKAADSWLLLKRNAFLYIFKSVQFIILAFLSMTLYFRTKMYTRNEDDGSIYNGALLLSLLINMFNGLVEISLSIARI